jgi:hypothetical protein
LESNGMGRSPVRNSRVTLMKQALEPASWSRPNSVNAETITRLVACAERRDASSAPTASRNSSSYATTSPVRS